MPKRSRRHESWRICFLLMSGLVVILLFSLVLKKNSGKPKSKFLDEAPPPPRFGSENDALKIAEMDQKQNEEDLLNEITLVQENFDRLEQTDPKLIRYIRARYLTPPPPISKPYNFKGQKSRLSSSSVKWIRAFYKEKRHGIFLEAGAKEGGSESSSTLELEIDLGWTGLLIECNPKLAPYLRNAGRKAWLALVCLSTNGYPQVVNKSIPATWGLKSTYLDGIEAVPLYPLLASVGITTIDYFSFDIEGSEWPVLKNFPFDKVLIRVLILNVQFYTKEERDELKHLLKRNGLLFLRGIELDKEIYVHESCIKDTNVTLEGLANI